MMKSEIRLDSVVRIVVLVMLLAGAARVGAEERVRDIVYGRKFGMALTLDVWKPPEQNGIGVIFLVSGGFNSDIEMINKGFLGPGLFKPMLDRGDTLFLVGHGAQPKFTVPEIVDDIHRAVRFIRVNAAEHGVDPNRLAIMGASSGGYLAISIGATGSAGDPSADDPVDRASSRVQAVGCFCPPSDLVNYGEVGRTFLEYEPVSFVWHVFGIEDRGRDEQIELLGRYSPLSNVTARMPPTMILHGDADVLVPIEQSERFAARLQEHNVPHQLVIREGAGHVWPEMAADMVLLADWFDKHLPPTSDESE